MCKCVYTVNTLFAEFQAISDWGKGVRSSFLLNWYVLVFAL